ncbi:peptidoglycan endopeptidase [Siccibacter colletis]|uniref:peptidoglycan endopeptidase n=1 Tax=Siccibacter colletis TaxID=1505757 RepID=UPI0039B74063
MTRLNGQASLTAEDFASLMIDVPWVNRACTFKACDCWGLVVLYYRHVLGKELHTLPGYESGSDFFTCHSDEVVFWKRSEMPEENGIFIGYTGNSPAHIGLIVNGRALHSRGENGAVRSDRLQAIEKVFTRVEYMTYASN